MDANTPLGQAQDWLRGQLDEGAVCPCCTQFARVYKRALSSAGARTVILLWRHHGLQFGNVPDLLKTYAPDIAHQGGYTVLGAHWGLIEEAPERREDGGRAGWWRCTELGRAWIQGETTIPHKARLYNGRCLGLTGDPRTVHQALGTKFNLKTLMES